MWLNRLWQRCRHWWRTFWRILRRRTVPVDPMPAQPSTVDPVTAEAVLMALLAGIAEAGWNRAAAQAFLIQKSCSASALAIWLDQFGAGLEPGQHDELAHRLQQLAHLQRREIKDFPVLFGRGFSLEWRSCSIHLRSANFCILSAKKG